MQTVILSLVVFALAMLGLGLGVLCRRAPLKGSCGGLACGNACAACPRKEEKP
ncbi:hypothetical protein [Paenirhodobacter populi]|uniref:hypothetical protein n=1 Tax=Paenirhodobacter populi TaxID=2306993 RepID=UPI0013E347DD|nr:hypothetical protein [Sinirhodobacter populi]